MNDILPVFVDKQPQTTKLVEVKSIHRGGFSSWVKRLFFEEPEGGLLVGWASLLNDGTYMHVL